MPHTIENGNVVYSDGKLTMIVGKAEKTETNRIDSETVEDVSYTFDIELGEYVEQSRETRSEPLPTPPPTDADKIAQLEAENGDLKSRVSDIEMFVADMIGGV